MMLGFGKRIGGEIARPRIMKFLLTTLLVHSANGLIIAPMSARSAVRRTAATTMATEYDKTVEGDYPHPADSDCKAV